MDWDRDFLLDWMGLTSVFHMVSHATSCTAQVTGRKVAC
jgi:hypothetical protein